MNMLQELLDSALHDALSFKKVGAKLIERKLKALGIILSDDQCNEIESKLESTDIESLALNVSDEQLANLRANPEGAPDGKIELHLNDDDLDELLSGFTKKIDRLFPEVISETSQLILKRLKSNAPSMLKEHRLQRSRFEKTVKKRWGEALDLLETFIVIAVESGADFNSEFRPQAAEEQDYVFEALTRLHARSCQVASEIHTLLRTGYADGAHARWRSLHEIATVTYFIKQSGQGVAEQYLLHDAIESYRIAKEYREHSSTLGDKTLSDEEFATIKSKYEHLAKRFGPSFKGNYGWASSATGKRSPTIKDIEHAVALEHLRPFYRLASHNVHANPKGVLFKLGLYPGNKDLLMAGPSITGLADPGHGAAISLLQVTTALLMIKPNLDRLVICDALMRLEQEIGEAFITAHEELEGQQAA